MRRTKSRKKDGFERGDYKKKSCAGGSELYREIGYVSKRKGLTRKGWRKDRRWGGGGVTLKETMDYRREEGIEPGLCLVECGKDMQYMPDFVRIHKINR